MKNRNQNLSREFRGKNILITGGTGSIGLGIVKQLTKYRPKEIRILSNDENSIVESIENLGKNSIYKFMVGDVRDKDRLNLAIRDIDIVYHAAAMKHIDICEHNPFDAVFCVPSFDNSVITSCSERASGRELLSKLILYLSGIILNNSSMLAIS